MDAQAQDRTVVLAVVVFLGLAFVGGLGALTFLVWTGADPTALLAISGPTTGAGGALAGILAATRTGNAAAEAKGAEKALAQVDALVAVKPPDAAV